MLPSGQSGLSVCACNNITKDLADSNLKAVQYTYDILADWNLPPNGVKFTKSEILIPLIFQITCGEMLISCPFLWHYHSYVKVFVRYRGAEDPVWAGYMKPQVGDRICNCHRSCVWMCLFSNIIFIYPSELCVNKRGKTFYRNSRDLVSFAGWEAWRRSEISDRNDFKWLRIS